MLYLINLHPFWHKRKRRSLRERLGFTPPTESVIGLFLPDNSLSCRLVYCTHGCNNIPATDRGKIHKIPPPCSGWYRASIRASPIHTEPVLRWAFRKKLFLPWLFFFLSKFNILIWKSNHMSLPN